jgi:hypothetical protein
MTDRVPPIRWDDLTEAERLFVLACLDADETDSGATLQGRADALTAFVQAKHPFDPRCVCMACGEQIAAARRAEAGGAAGGNREYCERCGGTCQDELAHAVPNRIPRS